MPAPPSRPVRAPHELLLLLTLATVQFTHVVDFMVIMPLGPQFMRLFDVGPREFGLLISSYTFAAAVSGFVAAFWIDRFDRKRALLALYAGFIVATGLCGLAPTYALLVATRVGAGLFGGVMSGLVFAIIADLVPYTRRRGRSLWSPRRFRWPPSPACRWRCGSLRGGAGVRRFSFWPASRCSWRCARRG
jgi:predicted MFS family arabinose efflux permease